MPNEANNAWIAAFPYMDGPGMSLRDWFAGQMLSALGCNEHVMQVATAQIGFDASEFRATLASEAYAQADAMLAQRSKAEVPS